MLNSKPFLILSIIAVFFVSVSIQSSDFDKNSTQNSLSEELSQFDTLDIKLSAQLHSISEQFQLTDTISNEWWDRQFYAYGLTGAVNCAEVYNGDLYVGGSFLNTEDQVVGHIARWDGANWSQVAETNGEGRFGLEDSVVSMSVFNNRLVVGGDLLIFQGYFPHPCCNIVTWDGTNWEGIETNYINSDNIIQQEYNGKLYLFGANNHFDYYEMGTLDSSFSYQEISSSFSGEVLGATVYNNQLIVCGTFDEIDGLTVNGVAAFDGNNWTPLGVGVRDSTIYGIQLVNDLIVFNGELYVAGRGMIVDSVYTGLAKWDGTNWSKVGQFFEVNEYGNEFSLEIVNDLFVYDNKLIVSGPFNKVYDVLINGIVSWDGTIWEPFNQGMFDINHATEFQSDLIVGGKFLSSDEQALNFIASWDNIDWNPLVSQGKNGKGVSNSIFNMVTFNGEIIASGYFLSAGSAQASYIARWDGVNWHPMDSGLAYDKRIYDLEVYDNTVWLTSVKGTFRWNGVMWESGGSRIFDKLGHFEGDLIGIRAGLSINGSNIGYIYRFDGTTWTKMGGDHNSATTYYYDIQVYHDTLYICGGFTEIGSTPINYVAKWNGSEWVDAGAGLNKRPKALEVFNDKLIAASGGTELIEGHHAVAFLDGDTWVPYGEDAISGAHTIVIYNNTLYVVGQVFDSYNYTMFGVAFIYENKWYTLGSALGWGISINDFPRDAVVFDDKLYFGGDFHFSGGEPSEHFASWYPDWDSDGFWGETDNCPFTANADQLDSDNDGYGDVCDNCTDTYNPTQKDIDSDGIGDSCDTCIDTDNDTFGDPGYANNLCQEDNCPDTYNPNQLDTDNDGFGDECDNCPNVFNPDQIDSDGDSVADSCDNCPDVYNPDQADWEGDGIGNACCCTLRGNIDNDPLSTVDISDLVYFINYAFGGPGALPVTCLFHADVDASGEADISDIVYLVAFMFSGGVAPLPCP